MIPTVTIRALAVTLLLLASTRPAPCQAAAAGGIRGTVVDADFQGPLPGVRVTLVGSPLSAESGADGTFSIANVPSGEYTVTFSKDGFQRSVVSGVVVTPGRLTDLGAVELSIEVVELEEFVVTGEDLLAGTETALLEVRELAVQFQDAISQDLLKKAAASDAASALKLVTGTSVSEGKYATVRGLSDRYTGTTLNGVRLPASDDRRRAVQVDVFPTGTIESISVTKTFTPDLQGDFTGGGVDIRTKSIPDSLVLSASIGTEWDRIATGNERFLTYEGGGVTGLATAQDGRSMPVPSGTEFPGLDAAQPRPNPTEAAQAAADELDRVTRLFDPTMGVSRTSQGPGGSLSLLVGSPFRLGRSAKLGLLGAVTSRHIAEFYENAANNDARVDTPAAPGQPVPLATTREDSQGVDEGLLGYLGTAVLQATPNHEFALDLVGNRSAKDESRFQTHGEQNCTTVPGCQVSTVQNQTLRYIERDIRSIQLHGHDKFPQALTFGPFDGLLLDWYAARNETAQDEPDVRFFVNQTLRIDSDGDGTADQAVFQRLTSQGGSVSASDTNRRVFRSIDESSDVLSLSLETPFEGRDGSPGRVKIGAFRDRTERGYVQDSFYYDFQDTQCCDARSPEVAENKAKGNNVEWDDPDGLWTDFFTDPDRIGLAGNAGTGPPTRPTVAPNQLLWALQTLAEDINYTGEQSIDAWFAMAEVPLAARFDLVVGARSEATDLLVVPVSDRGDGLVPLIQQFCGSATCDSFPPDERPPVSGNGVSYVPAERATADIDETFWLPAVSLIWEPMDNMKTRAAWSRTIARPTFRELSPVGTEEFLAGDTFVGNPALVLSEIVNYDLRWEWFRRPGEVLAASLFRKDLTNPIEMQSFFLGSESVFQPLNFETGEVRGFEVEARTALDIVWDGLRGLAVGVNYTQLDSSVDVPTDVKESLEPFELDEETRRLQGQPAFLFNANLTYDHPRSGTSVGVFYNRLGDTLLAGASRGEAGVPNVFEIGRATLDVTIGQRLPKGMSLLFKGRNLLEEDRSTVFRLPDGREGVRTLQKSARVLGVALSWQL